MLFFGEGRESLYMNNKDELRKIMKKLRAERAGDADTEGFLNCVKNSGILKYSVFFVYNSFGSEADTHKLIQYLLSVGKTVCLPRVDGEKMLAVPYGGDMKISRLGVLEPQGEEYSGKINVAIMPLLAVDCKGARLGYGGGYYDRFFKDKNILKVGYCFDFQVIDEVPSLKHDVKVDMIITEKRVIKKEEVYR